MPDEWTDDDLIAEVSFTVSSPLDSTSRSCASASSITAARHPSSGSGLWTTSIILTLVPMYWHLADIGLCVAHVCF